MTTVPPTAPSDDPTLEERARRLLDELGGELCVGACCPLLVDGEPATAELRAAVHRVALADAVARLSVVTPDWRARVDPTTLDMNDPLRCVLGQVYGSYGDGLDLLYGTDAGPGRAAFAGSFPVRPWRDLLVASA